MKKTLIIISALLIVVFSTAVIADYSSQEDPLVTLSYINEKVIPQIVEEVTAKLSGTPVNTVKPTESEPVDLSTVKYSVVKLNNGEILRASGANDECTEIILRSGSVYVISPFTDMGIADTTAGKELLAGNTLTVNNYCIIPRGGDGRGIGANKESYLLVRGTYEIIK